MSLSSPAVRLSPLPSTLYAPKPGGLRPVCPCCARRGCATAAVLCQRSVCHRAVADVRAVRERRNRHPRAPSADQGAERGGCAALGTADPRLQRRERKHRDPVRPCPQAGWNDDRDAGQRRSGSQCSCAAHRAGLYGFSSETRHGRIVPSGRHARSGCCVHGAHGACAGRVLDGVLVQRRRHRARRGVRSRRAGLTRDHPQDAARVRSDDARCRRSPRLPLVACEHGSQGRGPREQEAGRVRRAGARLDSRDVVCRLGAGRKLVRVARTEGQDDHARHPGESANPDGRPDRRPRKTRSPVRFRVEGLPVREPVAWRRTVSAETRQRCLEGRIRRLQGQSDAARGAHRSERHAGRRPC